MLSQLQLTSELEFDMRRCAATLIEVLIAVGIVAVLVGLLLPAVLKVRSAAFGIQDKSNLRQVVLAVHNCAAGSDGRLPGWDGALPPDNKPYPLTVATAYLGITKLDLGFGQYGAIYASVPAYLSSLDPSLSNSDSHAAAARACGTMSSVAINHSAFNYSARLGDSFPDGTSQTIGLAEHYYATGDWAFNCSYMGVVIAPQFAAPGRASGSRSASFADPMFKDALPVTAGDPAVTRSSLPGVTFQVTPPLDKSDGRQLQALQPGGLKVAMMDGSVRTISPAVTETAFWALVTRDAGDIAAVD